jgi:predicted RecA/RadA family phage recombinase
MYETVFIQGEPVMVAYTPGVAIAAGQVVVQNNMVGIAHQPIAANALGDLAVMGGVYQCTADAAILVGKKVYWDDTNNKVTETVGSNKVFGWTVSASGANNDPIRVLNVPS